MTETFALYPLRVVELRVRGAKDRVEKYLRDPSLRDEYRIVDIVIEGKSNPEYRMKLKFPIFEMEDDVKKRLRKLIYRMKKDHLEIIDKTPPRIEMIPEQEFPKERVNEILNKHLNEYSLS